MSRSTVIYLFFLVVIVATLLGFLGWAVKVLVDPIPQIGSTSINRPVTVTCNCGPIDKTFGLHDKHQLLQNYLGSRQIILQNLDTKRDRVVANLVWDRKFNSLWGPACLKDAQLIGILENYTIKTGTLTDIQALTGEKVFTCSVDVNF